MANESGLPIGFPPQQGTYLKYGLQPAQGLTVTGRTFHTGGTPAMAAADGTDTAASATIIRFAEVFVEANATITGIAIFNGSVASDTVKVGLFDAAGTLLATNATGGVGTAGNATADSYQRIPFTSTVSLLGPATYYVYATAFETTAKTGLTMPATFTTGLGPIASLY